MFEVHPRRTQPIGLRQETPKVKSRVPAIRRHVDDVCQEPYFSRSKKAIHLHGYAQR